LKRVLFSPRARIDLQEIGDWIARDSPRRALSFVAELGRDAEAIGHSPEAFPRREDLHPGLRMAVHRPYLIFFTTDGEVVRIERVLHGARDLPQIFHSDGG
jgi:toxin ParE1/3/4